MLKIANAIVGTLVPEADALGVAAASIVLGEFGEMPLRPPAICVYVIPGAPSAVTEAGSGGLDDLAYELVVFVLAADGRSRMEALDWALQCCLKVADLLKAFHIVYDAIPIEVVAEETANGCALRGTLFDRFDPD